jgi:hypothetical protein
MDLQKHKDKISARKILEYVFNREIEEHKITAANLLGLAEIRIDSGDMKGALELLHRATLVVGQPFENLDAAASLLVRTGHSAEAAEFLEALVKAEPWNADARVNLAQAQMKAGKDAVGARAALMAIARSGELVYDSRLRAAAAAAPSTEMIWGSNELRVIGTNATAIPAAFKPSFFYQARLRAAQQAGSNELRMQLLRAAIEDYPNRDAARVPFFRAALEAKQNQLAITTLQPLMQSVFLSLKEGTDTEPASEAGEEPSPHNQYGWKSVPLADRAALARGIGSALDGLNRWPEAVRFLTVAAQLETAADRKAAVQKQIENLRARIRRRALNENRRPMIHPELEQDRTVRPMLVARSAPPPAAAPARRRTP